jgi:hypothetical protein
MFASDRCKTDLGERGCCENLKLRGCWTSQFVGRIPASEERTHRTGLHNLYATGNPVLFHFLWGTRSPSCQDPEFVAKCGTGLTAHITSCTRSFVNCDQMIIDYVRIIAMARLYSRRGRWIRLYCIVSRTQRVGPNDDHSARHIIRMHRTHCRPVLYSWCACSK